MEPSVTPTDRPTILFQAEPFTDGNSHTSPAAFTVFAFIPTPNRHKSRATNTKPSITGGFTVFGLFLHQTGYSNAFTPQNLRSPAEITVFVLIPTPNRYKLRVTNIKSSITGGIYSLYPKKLATPKNKRNKLDDKEQA